MAFRYFFIIYFYICGINIKRNIQQMRARLDALQKLLDETPVEEVAIPEAPVVPVVIPEPAAAPEPVKPIPEYDNPSIKDDIN